MVELLIVIGIIGILSAVLIGQFGGATESARATECLTHLRNLGVAVQNFGMTVGYYPTAGDEEYITIGGKNNTEERYLQHVGYISRYADPNPYSRNGGASSHQSLQLISPYGENTDQVRFCVTNGALWAYGGHSMNDYVCPAHRRYCSNKGLTGPGWSYVMNSYFGYDWSNGSEATGTSLRDRVYGSAKRPEKRLLFAELQWNPEYGGGIEATFTASGDALHDGVLQYDDGDWNGTKEAIGFNHKSGKSYYAHVCFADGHVEKIMFPSGMGASQQRDLTKWLCDSDDVQYVGNQYERRHKASDE